MTIDSLTADNVTADTGLFISNLSVGYKEGDEILNGATVGVRSYVGIEGNADLAGSWMDRHTDTATYGGHLILARSRGTTHATAAVCNDNDYLGRILAAGYDGTDYAMSSQIHFEVDDASPAANQMGGAIVFSTAADSSHSLVEKMRIANNGYVGIGTNTPTASLDVAGTVSADVLSGDLIGVSGAYVFPTSKPSGAGAVITYDTGVGKLSWSAPLEQKDIHIVSPDQVHLASGDLVMFAVDDNKYPNGIVIERAKIATSASTTTNYLLREWTSPPPVSPVALATLSLSGANEAVVTSFTDNAVAAGGYVVISVDTTVLNWAHITVWYKAA